MSAYVYCASLRRKALAPVAVQILDISWESGCYFRRLPDNKALSLFKIVGVFIGDDGRMLFAELKVLVFDDTGIRSFAIGIVHDCIVLEVFYIREVSVFESQAEIFQVSACIIEVFFPAL